jgi:DNA polymerase-3 subunit gamma/tau
MAAIPYRVLARKYRPANFSQLIGQDALVRTLTNAIKSGRLAHAFLLTGVRGVGKTTTARIIARALNCTGPDGTGGPTIDPCGVCDHCRAIAEDRDVDVMEMDAASRTGVNDMREILDGVRYLPVSARFKIYIIDEVHMLSNHAFNALLKTLEEPPEHVKFVLATTEIRKIPVTVLSRCQRFDLRRVDAEILQAHFAAIAKTEKVTIDPPALGLIARAADGSVRDGLSLLDQAIAHADATEGKDPIVTETQVRAMLGLADRIRIFDLFEALMGGRIAPALDILTDLHKLGTDPAIVLSDLLDVTHWITRLKLAPAGAGGGAVAEAERVKGIELAANLSMAVLTRTWQMLLKGLNEVKGAAAPLQAAEMVLVRLAFAADLPSPADLVNQLRSQPAQKSESTPPFAPSAPDPGSSRAISMSATGGGQQSASRLAATAPAPVQANTAPELALASFEDVVALFRERREMIMVAHLMGDVHLVRFEPGRIEFRLGPNAPADLAPKISRQLNAWTGQTWLVSVSDKEPGAATLRQQAVDREIKRKQDAASLPLVQAILTIFPGASIEAVRDIRASDSDEPPPPLESMDDNAPGFDPFDGDFE